MSGCRFGSRCEQRRVELLVLLPPGWHGSAVYGAVRFVFIPSGPGEIAARHALDIDAFRFAAQHGAAGK